jgi:hypothetical protein
VSVAMATFRWNDARTSFTKVFERSVVSFRTASVFE